ncbi:MAG: tetratricopeptide repeat protein [Acidobacteria bacterium]|nr:tetratricopeptide repeat protein [Acidobacteriota bacterium]
MKIGKALCPLNVLVAALLFTASNVSSSTDIPSGRKFAFSTKSKEAKEHVDRALRMIENFQFSPQVLAVAKKGVEADPQFAFAHYLVGATTSPSSEAKPHMEKALELAKNASDGERRFIEAVALVQAKKPETALGIVVDLAKQYPDERLVHMMLGQINANQGKLEEAKRAFEKAIRIDGGTPRVYGSLGNVYLLKGDYGKAREFFKTSLSKRLEGTAPNVPNYGLAFTYLYKGDVKSALEILEGFRDEYTRTGGRPDLPPVFVWNSIGRLLLENGRAAESIQAYENGYATVPGSSISEEEKKIWLGRFHHGRGRALAKMGKHEEAWKEVELIKKMIEEAGERGKQFEPASHYLAGYLKLESGDFPAAIDHLKQADQTDPFHKLLLARAYEKVGDQANAQKIYKEIVESTQNSMERALAYPEAKKKLKI